VIPVAIFLLVSCGGGGSETQTGTDGIALSLVAGGMTSPVTLAEAPDGSGRLFIVDQAGTIRILTAGGTLLPEPFLDLRARMITLSASFDERGLLGLAFHPGFSVNERFFVYYSAPLRAGAPAGWNHTSHISEFRVSADDGNRADPGSERILLQVDEPQANHNAGTLAFGPDGFLYISLGDGGGGNDEGPGHVEDWYLPNAGGNGQDVTANLLGSILRIDVDGGPPYGIPADNPFVGLPGLDEIFAYGFRNPYRMSFDMGGSRDLIVSDAGQALWEEVSVVVRGGNFGWNVKEGTHCFSTRNPTQSPASCPDLDPEGDPLIDPVIEFANSNQAGGLGLAAVGGHFYRGAALPELAGLYIFGSWSSSFQNPQGRIFVATPRPVGLWDFYEPVITSSADGRLGHFVLGFGQDLDGEVYVLTTDRSGPEGNTGQVFKIVSP
jgi:glucose/arabinose dehydrogenase